jgi:ribosomal protein S27AE
MTRAEKMKVHVRVSNAVKKGAIEKSDKCSICRSDGGGRIVAHHFDYDKPMQVTWLCSRCHSIVHGSHSLLISISGRNRTLIAEEANPSRLINELLEIRYKQSKVK